VRNGHAECVRMELVIIQFLHNLLQVGYYMMQLCKEKSKQFIKAHRMRTLMTMLLADMGY